MKLDTLVTKVIFMIIVINKMHVKDNYLVFL